MGTVNVAGERIRLVYQYYVCLTGWPIGSSPRFSVGGWAVSVASSTSAATSSPRRGARLGYPAGQHGISSLLSDTLALSTCTSSSQDLDEDSSFSFVGQVSVSFFSLQTSWSYLSDYSFVTLVFSYRSYDGFSDSRVLTVSVSLRQRQTSVSITLTVRVSTHFSTFTATTLDFIRSTAGS